MLEIVQARVEMAKAVQMVRAMAVDVTVMVVVVTARPVEMARVVEATVALAEQCHLWPQAH